MHGIGYLKNKWPPVWRRAAGFAVIFHLALLALELPLATTIQQPESFLNIALVTASEPEEVADKPEPEEDTIDPPTQDETVADNAATQEPPNTDETSSSNQQPDKEVPPLKTSIVTVPSTTGEAFQEFIKGQTDEYIDANPTKPGEFAATFRPPKPRALPDIKYNGGGALGGGLYKVRKNGVICDQLTMVPTSFDDFLGGTISIVGNCKDQNSNGIELLDENGKIKNTDHQDWSYED